VVVEYSVFGGRGLVYLIQQAPKAYAECRRPVFFSAPALFRACPPFRDPDLNMGVTMVESGCFVGRPVAGGPRG